ncbi:CAP domain-containing protein [Chitinophaga sp. Cy-1792]|uniref:CAP domain-containing protein n=1 Tax=Chitinophaga sp. Cy-1792 TaxID=2608339 RepID=UPI00141F4605|nr:CAP domain-containing protein [Chitinophaga sp. Cy-1792]NIG52369.1 CAP domain-containing protein [Chitinophaga sp. Cy-1792]
MSGKFILTAFVAVVLFSSCTKQNDVQPIAPTPTTPVAVDTTAVPENHVDRNALLTLVNGLRSHGCKCGDVQMPPVGPLTWNGLLEEAAYLHSKDMSVNKYFDHTAPTGSTPGARLDAAGYHWNFYGENIATGTMDEQAVVLGWLNSPNHCKNMMTASYTELGVGRYDKMWTMELGHRNNPQ